MSHPRGCLPLSRNATIVAGLPLPVVGVDVDAMVRADVKVVVVAVAARVVAARVVVGRVVAAHVKEAVVAEVNFSKQPIEGATLKITWVKSAIGHNKGQKETIQSLGLNRLNQTVEHPDSLQLRGQIFKVKHLLTVEEA